MWCNRCDQHVANPDTGLCWQCESALYVHSVACILTPIRLDTSVRRQAAQQPVICLPACLEDTQELLALDVVDIERSDGDPDQGTAA